VTLRWCVDLPTRPDRLPFLESISWFDADPYALAPLDMLGRYERGIRHLHGLGELAQEERAYLAVLVRTFGSFLDVPA
jgi:hypothetical protein